MSDFSLNPFKASKGDYFTKQLFFELTEGDKSNVLYTLKHEDHTYKGKTYPSLRRIYLELEDETEYQIATRYFGGWAHWKKLLDTPWFLDYVSEFREELKVKLLSESLKTLREKAKNGSETAAKFLYEKGVGPKSPVGRPTKKAIKEEARRLTEEHLELQEDFQRVMLQ